MHRASGENKEKKAWYDGCKPWVGWQQSQMITYMRQRFCQVFFFFNLVQCTGISVNTITILVMTEFEGKPVGCQILRPNLYVGRQLTHHHNYIKSKSCFERQKIISEYSLSVKCRMCRLLIDEQYKSVIGINYETGLPLQIIQFRHPKWIYFHFPTLIDW